MSNQFRNLPKRTILITGATSGIGLHLACRLHQLGNQIIACGSSQQLLDQLAAEHLGMATHLGDITQETQRRKLADWATAQYPALNIVINNAGMMRPFDLNHPVGWGILYNWYRTAPSAAAGP